MSLTIASLALAGCGGSDACHVGLWEQVEQYSTPGCSYVTYLHLRADGRLLSLSTIQCELDGQPQLYLLDSEPYQRAYTVSGTDFVLQDDSHYYESRGALSCAGDAITIAGNYHDGAWTRLSGTERAAAADVFGLQCHPFFHSCVGGFFNQLSCTSDADCPFSPCWVEEGTCDVP